MAPRKAGKKGSGDRPLRILFTSVGRRVALVEAFRHAAERLGITVELHGSDLSPTAPGIHRVDKPHAVPRISSDDYIPATLDLVRRQAIDLLIPLLDTELPPISEAHPAFAELGCTAVVSAPHVVGICRDKLLTFEFLKGAGFDTPRTRTFEEVSKLRRHRFPYFLKPRFGSAAVGNHLVKTTQELAFHGSRVDDALLQEFLVGLEFTSDVYTGLDGTPRCAVPRRRLEVRGGEVSKGVTAEHPAVIATATEVARKLGGCVGVVTVQCIETVEGRIGVIEINPRFGGGVPLAIEAGADFPGWLMLEALGRKPRIGQRPFKPDVAMLRYDDAVFVRRASRRLGI